MMDFANVAPALYAGIAAVIAFLLYAAFTYKGEARRLRESDDPNARLKVYNGTIVRLWGLAAVCTLLWLASGQTLTELGFRGGEGWRYGLAWAGALLAVAFLVYQVFRVSVSRDCREEVREQLKSGGDLDLVKPDTPAEHGRFQWVAVTAGITEEIIFRGFLIGAFALMMPLWAAAVVATVLFVLGHAYQGVKGMLRVSGISFVLAGLFVLGGSLWPVIVLHILADAIGGGIFWIVDAHEEDDGRAEAVPA